MLKVRKSRADEDDYLASNFFAMWQDYDVHTMLRNDWHAETLAFIAHAREHNAFAGFIAERSGERVGSACCQLFSGLYPSVFKPEARQYGYVWGVYAQKAHRRQGVAKQLMHACINHLETLKCSKVLLHASPMGRPVYETLGFTPGNEMILELRKQV